MNYMVQNCFHWIGYHILNALLEKGYRVDGADDLTTGKKENLAMFVGRNDLFRHVPLNNDDTEYDVSITVKGNTLILCKQKTVTIHLPLLFGKWMPMNQQGIYYGDAFYSFDAEEVVTQAVHIEDLLESLMQWIHASCLPSSLIIKSRNDHSDQDDRHGTILYIRQRWSVKQALQSIKNHYETYNAFY
ncbi:hypothetical protein GCM10008983_07180 [Lentibacillus halophilus]|uniref:Uncharacterized protein n=1 Tax=Lentibacillus halophilus TaxID=295065 RepID=A0ABP3IYT7_9BACI